MRRSLVLACALTLLVACRTGKRSSEPTITSSLAGKADVDLFAPLAVDFDADMDTATLTAESVQLRRGGDAVSAQVSAGARRGEIVANFGLEPLTAYEIVVTTAAKTRDGRSATRDVRFAFVTRASVPDDPPRLIASTPSLGAMVVPTTTLSLDFDRPLLAASVGAASIFVRPAGMGALSASHRLSADARRVTLTTAQLLGSGVHELVVTDAVQSSTGAALPRQLVVPFAVREGFFVVRAEPAARARLGLGLSRLRLEFNRAPRLGSAEGVRLSRGGVAAPLSVVAEGLALDLEVPPLDREGEYELSVDDVVDPANSRLTEPFRSTFTVDAQETGWTVPREIALQGLLSAVSLGTNVAFASNQSGRAAVLWLEEDRTALGRNAFVATFDGEAWSAPLALTTGAADVASPQVAINEAGDVLAVWSEHTGAAVTRARLRARTQWGVTQSLTSMARALVVDLATNGDATVLGTRDREVDLLACASIGGSFQATYVLFAGFSVATAPTEARRWQHDDSGRRLVVFSHEDGKGFRLRATWLVPGQGATTSVPIFDGSAFYVTVYEHVTPSGDAVVIFLGARRGQRSDLFAQCFRRGTWLPDAQALGSSLRRDDVLVSGRSGDTLLLASRVEGGRARPHARLLRASLGAFDAGRNLDEAGGAASIDGLRLFGSPDAQAAAYFDRADQTGSFTVQSVWDPGANAFLPGERATAVVPRPSALAHDRDGNAVMLVGDAGMRFVQGAGFVAERRNPFPSVPEATPVVSRYGRIDLIGVRTEQRGAERYDFLRVTSYR